MNDVSTVSLSTRAIIESQPDVVKESIRFHSLFHGEVSGNFQSLSSGSHYTGSLSDARQRLLALIGTMDTD